MTEYSRSHAKRGRPFSRGYEIDRTVSSKKLGEFLKSHGNTLRLIEADRIFGQSNPFRVCKDLADYISYDESEVLRCVWLGIQYRVPSTKGYFTLPGREYHIELMPKRPCKGRPVLEETEFIFFPGVVDAAAYFNEPVAYVRRQLSGYPVNRWFDGRYSFVYIDSNNRDRYYDG